MRLSPGLISAQADKKDAEKICKCSSASPGSFSVQGQYSYKNTCNLNRAGH
jgi:hypothetical protein